MTRVLKERTRTWLQNLRLVGGSWVASWIAWFPVDAWNSFPEFANHKSDPPRAQTWIEKLLGQPVKSWDERWEEFKADPENQDEIRQASLKPAPFAVLGRFRFQADLTFRARLDVNNLERFEPFEVHGTYDVEPDPEGGYGGEIRLLENSGAVHFRIKFLLVDEDEMKFITSYRQVPEPESPDAFLQTVAGTMKRSRLAANPVTDPFDGQVHPTDSQPS